MPYANNNGVKIYYEVEGQGPPLVLAHSVQNSLEQWRRYGYTNDLKNDFQLILFDARGHGKSDKPHEPDLYGPKMAEDVIIVLDNIGFKQAHYLGYSMGAMTGYRVAISYPERFYSFILGGWDPYEKDMVNTAKYLIEGLNILRKDPEAAMRRREQNLGRPLTPEERNSVLANDVDALIAMLTSFLSIQHLTDQDLIGISCSALLYSGELDPGYNGAKKGTTIMPNAKFISLPGMDHLQGGIRSDIVLPHIKAFLAQVSKR